MRDGDGDLLVRNQVFQLQLGGFIDDLGATHVAVLVADFGEFADDDLAELLLAGQDGFVLGDVFADDAEFFEQLVHGELGQAVELQFEDGVDLPIAEDERGCIACTRCEGGAQQRAVHAVFGGIERDAVQLGAAQVDAAAAEEAEEVFAGVGAAA